MSDLYGFCECGAEANPSGRCDEHEAQPDVDQPCKRSLYLVEVQEHDAAETTSEAIRMALAAAGIVTLGEIGAWGLDDYRGGEDAPEQHYRPECVCRCCGWPFTDWQGETYCDECKDAIGEDQGNPQRKPVPCEGCGGGE